VGLEARDDLKKPNLSASFQLNSYTLFLDKKTPALELVFFITS
jgi:hypothetical protein